MEIERIVKIPSNLDLNYLKEKLDILINQNKKTIKIGDSILNNHVDGLIYFVKLLVKGNHNIKRFGKNNFRNLNTEFLSNIIGKGDDRKRVINIIQVLKNENIIESYNHRGGFYSRGYKLTDKYNIDDYKEVELSDKIHKNIIKFFKNEQELDNNSDLLN
jgi:hypothetical protein